MSAKTILVVGATGNQGSAVVDELEHSDADHEVLGLTRDASTDRARAAADLGAELVEGDIEDPETIEPYFERADAVFATTNFWTLGYDRQVEHGEILADVADSVGVDHFVYSGAGNQDLDTGVPHLDSHEEIADALRDADVPLTLLQPVFFMENWEVFVEDAADGTLAFPLAEDTEHYMTSYRDTARAARVALENPSDFIGTTYDVASDKLTLTEIVDAINDVGGFDAQPYHVPIEDAYEEFGEEFGIMCEWFVENGGLDSFEANVQRIERDFGFRPQRFGEYLHENGWADDKSAPAHVPGWVKGMQ